MTLNAGDVLVHTGESAHAVKTSAPGRGAGLATYVVEKGKPLAVLVR